MDLKRAEAFSVLLGGVFLSVAAGFVDWRAGLAVFGGFLIVVGGLSLRSGNG